MKTTGLCSHNTLVQYASTIHPVNGKKMIDWFNCAVCKTTKIKIRSRITSDQEWNRNSPASAHKAA